MQASHTSEPPAPPRQSRWLSRDFSHLISTQKEHDHHVFDVVVVGSGYGGAMAAATLAGGTVAAQGGAPERPVKLCVLERGEEYNVTPLRKAK